jgi:hypothetical protein
MAAPYRAFVSELHEHARKAKRRPRFRAGLGWRQFAGWLLTNCDWTNGIPIPPILFEEQRRGLRRNFPRRYRPTKIPQELLPSI